MGRGPALPGRPLRGPTLSQVRVGLVRERLAYAASKLPGEDLCRMSDQEVLEAFEGVLCATVEEVRQARQELGISSYVELAGDKTQEE